MAWLLIAACIPITASQAEAPQAPAPHADIAPQALPEALAEFALHTGLQVIYVSALVEGKNSKGARGEGKPADVLAQLLEGTGLRFTFLNAKTVQILPPASHAARSSIGTPQRAIPAAARAGDTVDALEEVVVTASRREEKQNEVPISIMTWTAAMLAESGVKSLGALATRTPGVEFDYYPDLGPGTLTNIAIRGVNARDGSATGIFLDDTTIPSDSGGTFGKPFPFPFDLERVEVLRGPQGTLLGEGTEGGAIRLIQASPSLSKSSAYVRGQVATTANGDPSYDIGAAGGGPLKENVIGFRASAWGRWQGGYIDRVDPFTNQVTEHNANRVIDESVHGALSAALGGEFLLTPAVTYQSLSSQDAPTFTPALSDPGSGDLRSGKLLAQPARDEFTVATLTLAGPLRSAQLSAVTSYFHRHVSEYTDATNNPDNRDSLLGTGYPRSEADAILSTGYLYQSMWSQEIRLTSESSESRSSWILGGLYQHTNSTVQGLLYPHRNRQGMLLGAKLTTYDDARSSLAAYGEVRMRLGERVTADLGIRAERTIYDVAATGAPLLNPDPLVTRISGRESPLSPKFVMEYRPSGSSLLYAGVTSGYRNGGVNSRIYWWCREVTPVAFQPDKVWNYEVGSKETLLDGRMQIDASLFHMQWQRLQNTVAVGGCDSSYIATVGGAVSNGFDLGVQAAAGSRTRLGLSVGYTNSYTDTVVTNGAIPVHQRVAVGSLPLVASPLDATASVTYDLPVSRGYTLTARVEDVFHSHNPGPFDSQDPASRNYDPGKRSNPATNVLNLRFSARRPGYELSLGIDNALNSQPVLLLRDAFFGSDYFYASTLRPRTVSLDVDRRF